MTHPGPPEDEGDPEDYYGYAPLLTLERPVALVGIPGAQVGRTARAVNLLSGLPLVWLDRRVEHRLGRAAEAVQVEQGASPRLAFEREELANVWSARTPPLVALSDVTYADQELARAVEERADVVLLHLDVDRAAARILEAHAADRRRYYALITEIGGDPTCLRAALIAREQRYRHLARVVLVQGREPVEVAHDVLASLGMERPEA